MKLSVNWLKEFTRIELSNEDLVKKIGAQLGEVESVENLGEKYKGALIVRVVECLAHPNADKLHACKIDDGGVVKDIERDENGHIQIVCGANNIDSGQIVIWLPPGSIVPETFGDSDPFVLEAKELRGVKSHGMIASARELDFGDDHQGIVVLSEDFKPGTPLSEAYDLDDCLIEIENKMFTHRPDLFGILGLAREVAGIQNIQFTSPNWYLQQPNQTTVQGLELSLNIKNELPELAPRFMAVCMSNISIKPSPLKLQTYLFKLGIRPINNVVDITNFMMLLTAQPLHAYDYDKVLACDPGANSATLSVRFPKQGETLKLLNGKTIEPYKDAMLICSETKPIGLAGVMGGNDTEVDATTKNIIIECANFNMYSIRRTSMIHGLFTDAVTRFNKGQSPLQNDRVVSQTIKMMQEVVGAEPASPVIDNSHIQSNKSVQATPKFINERLGLELDANQIKTTLENVEIKVDSDNDNLTIQPPFWRTDIEIEEDVVEEVGRLIGFDKLPLKLPMRSIKPAKDNRLLELKNTIRQILSAAGANELLTYSFVHGNLLDRVGQDKAYAFQINNALSPELQYYRLSLLPSLLEKVHLNIKSGFDNFALFELGKAHIKEWLDEDNLPGEADSLEFVFAADSKAEKNFEGAAYYQAKNYLTFVLNKLGITPIFSNMPDQAVIKYNEQRVAMLEKTHSAIVMDKKSGDLIGVVGEFKKSVKTALKLPDYCAGFEIDVLKLIEISGQSNNYIAMPKYPKVEQDISLKVPVETKYWSIYEFVESELEKNKPSNSHFELFPLDIYQRPDDESHKQISLRLKIASYDKTMKAEEVNQLLDAVALQASQKFGAERL